ncbi:hypothetical protein J2848_000780 [Azospirillum lipoferum]|uniref:Calcium-binding protein n=1 Tax=Azospirillum lipoferum TaxID=193 RepID=A0A5A9GYE8_AZOLI|nr:MULTISPECIES: hypothetical protein [Azospirillum]KAA0598832.1 hypothetical protein FZ942_07130 [Azospirillum lipoferum]MCP1609133.1 hypothetical protein [Azospirillum lipoferum]MDW5535557.1 hypothetical protein [Azospirillum sp. NL1]
MARFIAGGATGVNTDNIYIADLLFAQITGANSTFISASYGGGTVTEFYGNFAYNSTGTNVVGGTISAIRSLSNGRLSYTVDNLSVPATTFLGWLSSGENSTARSSILSGSDAIFGSEFNDTMRGYAGNDTILGGGGSDLLDGGTGINLIDGGAGDDTVQRSGSTDSSTAFSYGGSVYVYDSNGYDQLIGVEYIRFSDRTVATSSVAVLDPLSYLAANPDLAAAFGGNTAPVLSHYLSTGIRERRSTTFDAASYLAANPDLAAAFGANTVAATQHYINSGRLENRNTSFNAMSYIAANPDLIQAFGANRSAAALHYATTGRLEGRSTTFNASAYLARYPDLRWMYGTSELGAATHYVTSGYREGRSAAPLTTSTGRSAQLLASEQASTALAAAF